MLIAGIIKIVNVFIDINIDNNIITFKFKNTNANGLLYIKTSLLVVNDLEFYYIFKIIDGLFNI